MAGLMAKKTAEKDEIKEVVKPAVNPVGRPTKYDPKYCQEAINFMANGFSPKALAAHLKTDYTTIYEWAKVHPEFSHALKEAQAASALWWEQRLMENADSGKGNASSCIFGVKNRSQEQWKDRHEVDNTSSDGTMSPKRIEIVAPTTII